MKHRAIRPAPRRRSTGPAVGIALALLLGTVPGCADDRDDGSVGRGSAFTSPIVDNGVKNTYRMAIQSGVVAITGLEEFKSQRKVVVESVAPLRAAAALEILTMRLNFIAKKGTPGPRGFQGAICTDRWPPVRFVDFLETPLEVNAGDRIGVTVFVRPRATGDYDLTGVRIRYREDGVLKEQTTESTTLIVVARDSKSELPESAYCPPDVPHHELGQVSTVSVPSTVPGSAGDGHGHEHS